jgi:hypothetical protein
MGPVCQGGGHHFWLGKRKIQRIYAVGRETLSPEIHGGWFAMIGFQKGPLRKLRGVSKKKSGRKFP